MKLVTKEQVELEEWQKIKAERVSPCTVRCTPLEYWTYTEPIEVEEFGLSGFVRSTINEVYQDELSEFFGKLEGAIPYEDLNYLPNKNHPVSLSWKDIAKRKNVEMRLYLLPQEHLGWKRIADKMGLPLASFIRSTLNLELAEIREQVEQSLRGESSDAP